MRSRLARRVTACTGLIVMFFALALVTDHARVTISLINLIVLTAWNVVVTFLVIIRPKPEKEIDR